MNDSADSVKGGAPLACSVGVMAYNEEMNIGRLLGRLLEQELQRVRISEIIVVASGCRDDTEVAVRRVAERDPRVRLISQPNRKGKASAIQEFLRESREDILLLVGADTLPARDAVERLVVPLADRGVGMTGARPVPLNGRDSFCGFAVHLFWELHHEAAKRKAKCGEMVAFKRVLSRIPACVVVDEPYIAGVVRKEGLHVAYCPDAVVKNQGPATVVEILMRRRNIVAGYLELARRYRIRTRVGSRVEVAVFLLKKIFRAPARAHWVLGAVGLEVMARFLGWWDFRFRRGRLYVWPVAWSTKRLDDEENG
ncbi:MAG: glycosyltransferase [bacterium]